MKNNLIIYFLAALLMQSCNNNSVYETENLIPRIDTIRISPEELFKSKALYSDIFEKIEYIQIPTDSNFLIGQVDKLLVTSDYLFILDRKITRSVFAFDKDGNKLMYINKTGNAPGEYVAMRDIVFNKNTKELLIYCVMRRKILHYNINGEFLYETDMPYSTLRVQPLMDKYVLYNDYFINKKLRAAGREPNLLLLDAEENVISSTANYFTPFSVSSAVITSEAQFSLLNDTLVSIKPDHCNYIYHATPHEIYPAYFIDFGSYNIDGRYWNKAMEKGATLEKVEEHSYSLGLCETFRFWEGENYMHIICRQKGKTHHVFYSKKTKTIRQVLGFQNDMDLLTLFRPIAIYNDKLYGLLDTEVIYNNREYFTELLPEHILNTVQELDNPIISIFTLKPF